jgi:hypothetical protein
LRARRARSGTYREYQRKQVGPLRKVRGAPALQQPHALLSRLP